MVVNTKEQEIKKFIKYLYRKDYMITKDMYLTEEQSLELVSTYWRDTN